MDYTKTVWRAGDPITESKLNNIEIGIFNAYNTLTTNVTQISTLQTSTNALVTELGRLSNQVAELDTNTSDSITNAALGKKAYDEIVPLLEFESDEVTIKKHLADWKSEVMNNFSKIETEFRGARKQYVTLGGEIDYIEEALSRIDAAFAPINQKFVDASGIYNTVQDRFAASESAISTLQSTTGNLQSEIVAGRGVNGTSLDARFSAAETRITDVESNKIPYSALVANLTTNSDNVPLSASQGYALASMIGGNYSSSSTVADAINTIGSSAQSYADTKVAKADVYNNTDYEAAGKVLDARVGKTLADAIESLSSNTSTTTDALDARIDAIESELDMSSAVGERRFDSIEDRLDTLDDTENGVIKEINDKISTIADELGMTDTNGLKSIGTRVDSLDDHVTLLATELGMVSNGEIQNVTSRVDTLESTVNDASTGLAATKAIADAASATANAAVSTTQFNTALASKANTSDVSLTIVKAKQEVSYTEGVPSENQSWNIVDRNDYLLQSATDDKYYYWKHINNAWHLMGGAGGSGTGTSSAEILAVLPSATNADENTDYYIGTQQSGYLHYRFIDVDSTLTPVLIGVDPDNIKTYNIDIGTETVNVEGTDTDVNYLYFYEFDYGEDNTDTEHKTPTKIRLPSMGGGGGGVLSTQKLQRITERYLTQVLHSEDRLLLRFFYTSGEKGAGAKYTLTSGSTTLLSDIQINSGDPDDLSSTWPTKEVEGDNGETVTVEYTETEAAAKGFYQIDITDYCTTVTTGKVFKLTVYDVDDPSLNKSLSWEVAVINLAASTTLETSSINNVGDSLSVPYTITGNIAKTVYFKLDDVQINSVNLRANQSNTGPITIPAQTAGVHRLEIYATATVNGAPLRSNTVKRDLIWYDSSSSNIIISSPYRYRNSNDVINLRQYEVVEIPYTVVGGTSSNYSVEYYVDSLDNQVQHVALTNVNSGTWNYRANLQEQHTLYIKSGSTVIEIHINVEELDVDIAQVTDNLIIDFNPAGITNSSNLRNWSNGTYSMSVSNNFDWFSGGYGSDANGDYFLIKAGTRATINYKMFKSYLSTNDGVTTTNSTVFRDGAEMKIIFKTAAVRDADAVWFTNMGPDSESAAAKQVGIQLNTHNGWLRTNSASADNTKSYLYFPYSEEDRIELDININPQTATNAVYIMSYEDGCPSRAYPYDPAEALYQINGEESDIVLGSDDCDVYIYRFRVYNAALDTAQVLRNFISDGKDVNESIDRYNRNCIYYDTQSGEYTPYEGPDCVLDPERLAKKIPDVKVLMLDTPRFTTSKKDFVAQSSLRCIHAEGGKIYPSRGVADNWLFQNGYHAGQGTTSDKYGDAGRNLDFLFECDGVHNPSDKVKPDAGFIPNYQSSVIMGYGLTDAQGNSLEQEPKYCLDWKDEDTWKPNTPYSLEYTMSNGDTHDMLVRYNGQVYKCLEAHTSGETFEASKWELQEGYTNKISLTSTSIPNNFFNLKLNIASSENVNNALFQKRYNDFLPYNSPAYLRDSRIKNDMEFVPAIIFVRENDNSYTEENVNGQIVRTYTNHNEFNDTEWHFYGLGNIGDSKKTDYTRAYDPTDMNEFTLEISDNNTNNSQFQSGVYMAPYYTVVASPTVEDIDNYYEAQENAETHELLIREVDENTHEYRGSFIKTTDTEIDNNKTYYTMTLKRTIQPYHVEDDYDDKGKALGTKTAYSDEHDITVETTDYLFPINRETEWEAVDGQGNPLNMRYWSLFNEKFDGDHSFEMRYACKGDYRDGKVVNDTTGQAKAQLALNEKVWRAFYTWLVTSTDQQFIDELDQWCVRSSVAFFYAFTHYYTMIDNRAKNTFWHFAKTGKHRIVTRPEELMLHTYEEAVGTVIANAQTSGVWDGTFTPTTDTEIDPEKTYYTQYAFDMWVYDCDTAAGIDNNGELIFPYGKEDTDYRVDGDISSGPVFNGAGSIFWARLRENCNDNIVAAFTGVPNECFNAENLIVEFDKFQNCYPESVWRLDVERKYIRSFTGEDGATEENPYQPIFLTRQNTRFLGDMMQGRKKYQRRQWVKDQGVYFGSKYMLSNMEGNQFDMVCYNIGGQQVLPNWDLTITPYQDMYLNVDYGETAIRGKRAKKNVPVEIKCPFDSMNESRVRIYGADYIRALAGKPIKDANDNIIGAESLASLYFRGNDFSHTNKLRELYIGSSNPTYTNSQFQTLNISSNNPILEVLDIQNCDGLTGTLSLTESTSLKRIEAQGTNLSQIVLPGSTSIRIMHLPETITKIALNAAKNLSELTIKTRAGVDNVSNLTTLQVNDSDYSSNINWMSIAESTLSNIIDLQLINLNLASITDITELQQFAEKKSKLGYTYDSEGNKIDKVNLTGTIHVTGTWSQVEKDTYESLWSGLTLDVSSGTVQIKRSVTYVYEGARDGLGQLDPSKVYTTLYINDGDTAPELYKADGTGFLTTMPTKAPTAQEIYEFGSVSALTNTYIPYSGWHIEGTTTALTRAPIINENTVLETHFNSSPHTYNIKWYLYKNEVNGVIQPDPDSLVKTSVQKVAYGEGYNQEAPTVADIHAAGKQTCSVNIANGTVTYSIFKGWEKLPTNITPLATDETYNIYADWDSGSISITEMFASNNIDNLTPAQLLALSAMNSNIKDTYSQYITDQIGIGTRITYPLGYDHDTSNPIIGTNSSENISILRLDDVSTLPLVTNITPLIENNDAFTLAIDYCVDPDAAYTYSNGQGIIASCYYNDTSTNVERGFVLYFDVATQQVRLGFGNVFNDVNNTYTRVIQSASIANLRNIVVIRHPKNSSELYVYSGLAGKTMDNNQTDAQEMPSTIYTDSIYYQNFNTNAKLSFGSLGTEVNQGQTEQVKGIIYWAKYWNEDLGAGECKQLAAWPHETMTFAIAALTNNASSRAQRSPSIKLASLNTSNHDLIIQKRNSDDTYSWLNSPARTICNGRIFNSLPVELQAIMYQTPATARIVNRSSDSNGITSYSLGSVTAPNDYLYAYSLANVSTNVDYSVEGTLFGWLDTSNIKYYYYSTNGWVEDNANTNNSINYLNIRFPYKALSWGASSDKKLRVFNGSTNYPSGNIAESISATGENKNGDIYIQGAKAYMYVYLADIARLGIKASTNANLALSTSISNANERGQWIEADPYWLRSILAPRGGTSYTNFSSVDEMGVPSTSPPNTSTPSRKLSYIIAL